MAIGERLILATVYSFPFLVLFLFFCQTDRNVSINIYENVFELAKDNCVNVAFWLSNQDIKLSEYVDRINIQNKLVFKEPVRKQLTVNVAFITTFE